MLSILVKVSYASQLATDATVDLISKLLNRQKYKMKFRYKRLRFRINLQ